MAFDKNHTSTGMKVVIVLFAVILVVSMCVPFISSCTVTGSSADSSDSSDTSTSTATTTVASVKQQYSSIISSLEDKLAADEDNTTAMASLGNNYMDMAAAMRSASDASDNSDEVEAAYAKAAEYYEQYLVKASSQAVTVDHAVCLFYGGSADEAVSELSEYVQGDGAEYAMAWYNLAIMHYTGDTPDYASAVEEFNKAAELDSDGSAGINVYAQVYAQLAQSSLDAENEESDDSADATSDDSADVDAASDATADADEAATATSSTGAGVDAAEDEADSEGDEAAATSTTSSTSTTGTSGTASKTSTASDSAAAESASTTGASSK